MVIDLCNQTKHAFHQAHGRLLLSCLPVQQEHLCRTHRPRSIKKVLKHACQASAKLLICSTGKPTLTMPTLPAGNGTHRYTHTHTLTQRMPFLASWRGSAPCWVLSCSRPLHERGRHHCQQHRPVVPVVPSALHTSWKMPGRARGGSGRTTGGAGRATGGAGRTTGGAQRRQCPKALDTGTVSAGATGTAATTARGGPYSTEDHAQPALKVGCGINWYHAQSTT